MAFDCTFISSLDGIIVNRASKNNEQWISDGGLFQLVLFFS